jgi:hypothetical protein
VATVFDGAGDGAREARREFPATVERGVEGGGGGHAVQFRATAPSVHTLSETSANGLVLRETSSSKSSPKVQFGQEICPKCATLDNILVHIQTLDLWKGPLENVLSFPSLKFCLGEKICTGGDALRACLSHRVHLQKNLQLSCILERTRTVEYSILTTPQSLNKIHDLLLVPIIKSQVCYEEQIPLDTSKCHHRLHVPNYWQVTETILWDEPIASHHVSRNFMMSI